MKIISGLTLFFYTLIFLLVGGLFVAISLNLITQEVVGDSLKTITENSNTRLALGLTGILLVFISIMVVQITMENIKREKTIAFENPDGQVTISLTAIEDFIKRAIKQLPEVKELRPNVKASKKGISIVNRVILFSDIHIPETTEKIQNIVKTRVQDMLGVEEPINIKVHVVKIVHKEEPVRDARRQEKPQGGQHFKGSIEYGE